MVVKEGAVSLEYNLAEYLANITFDSLPEDVVNYCKLLVIDSLGVTLAGVRAPGCREMINVVSRWQVPNGSTILIYGIGVPAPLAALANSTMMHALDFDDTLDTSALHTFVSVFPSALAAAETRGKVSGKDFITALVAGVEITCRLGLACTRPLSWIRTTTCGTFGAAAAAGKILGLNYEELKNALGIAYSQSSGNAQCLVEGRLVKRLQPGFASQAGVISAFLARSGITGPERYLVGKFGFFPLYEHNQFNEDSIVENLGTRHSILSLSIKSYPCCRMTHASIDAALSIREFVKDRLDTIEKIEVLVPKMPAEMVGKPFEIGPNPQVDAQFSIPYTVSVALIRGDVFLQDFEVPNIIDEKVLSLAKKVKVVEAPDFPAKEMSYAALTVKMVDGREFRKEVRAPIGSVENPLTKEQCYEKFRKCLEYSKLDLDAVVIDELIEAVEELEKLDDVGRISRLARAKV